MESTIVKTEIIAKIPIVIPSNDKKVRSLFAINEPIANLKLSANNRKKIMVKDTIWSYLFLIPAALTLRS